MSSGMKVVVIGGVACGPKTASRLKRLMPEAQVTMIDKGKVLSYGACGMPYHVSGEVPRLEALVETPVGVKRDAGFFRKVKGFESLTETEVMGIDRAAKAVEAAHGPSGEKRSFPYDKLVLATGGRPFVPQIPGRDLEGVHQMNRYEDAALTRALVDRRGIRKAVIIGAGLIGIEMAEALKHQGVEVTIVEMLPTVMGLLLDPDMGLLAMKHLSEKGIALHMNERVEALTGDGQGRVRAVKTSRGELEADYVLLSIGVRPNSDLARGAGLALDQKGGILVNSFCQTSDPDIYAGGDCVSNDDFQGVHATGLFAPQGSTANKHGRLIANHIAGMPEPFPGILGTVICRAFDFTLARTGLTATQARGLGYDVETVTWTGTDLPHFLPGSKPLCLKLIVNRRTRELIGFQGVGLGDVAKRLDVAATAMSFRATIDRMANLDLGYAPPYSPPLDPILTAVHVAQNKLNGLTRSLNPMELRERLEQGDPDILLLDVRGPAERQEVLLPYEDRTVHIPLGALRERLGELPRDKTIVPFCKVSLRGYEAERILSQAGFPKTAFLDGGILAWPFERIVPPKPGA